ncbi:hypothetical protein HZY88_08900 [Aerococcaceae bacterium DSM 111176]|nr:hypothetical protein [Aerococcaceae bacterium DSM 111176]
MTRRIHAPFLFDMLGLLRKSKLFSDFDRESFGVVRDFSECWEAECSFLSEV